MSDKIIDVIEAICRNPKRISEITISSTEYYFCYKGHTMSMMYAGASEVVSAFYTLFVYPEWNGDLEDLSSTLERVGPSDIDLKMAAYRSDSFPDEGPFMRLYNLLQVRYLNVDDILDDILSDADDDGV